MIWKENKEWQLLSKIGVRVAESQYSIIFPCSIYLESFGATKGGFFCLGGILGQSLDFGPSQTEGKTSCQ